MSRIGRLPVPVVAGVKVDVGDAKVTVTGPKGSLAQALPGGISAEVADGKILVKRRDDSKTQRALHGLSRALLANAVTGVTKGFSKDLEIQGVGYRAQASGKTVSFTLGYTHAIEFPVPDGIQIAVDKQTKVTVTGIDRQQVGQVAAKIRSLRPPDVYKGKGVRYANEVVRKKAGKTGAK
ncbi:MAG TPA: 50S ribosomal protein L6 [Candidatus Polarisedimenticolaceae bacterium]|nr:50S ribosomal protein L6 [Candidatus Polarisedimenticolaceae bacterium]